MLDTTFLFQFTTVAGVLASTAVFWVASSREVKVKDWCIVWVLLICAATIRRKTFPMALPVIIVIFIAKIAQKLTGDANNKYTGRLQLIKNNRIFLIKILIVSIAGTALMLSLRTINLKSYSEEPWKSYLNYIHNRSLIMDYYKWPPYEGNEEFWDSLEISNEEYNCLGMYGVLPNVNEDKIGKIAEYSQKIYCENTSYRDKISKIGDVFVNAAKSKTCRVLNILLVMFFLIAVVWCFGTDKSVVFWRVITAAVIICEIMYLCYKGRFPNRVIAIFDYMCILGVLGMMLSKPKKGKSRKYMVMCFVLIFSALILCLLSYKKTIDQVADYNSKLNIYSEELAYIKQYPQRFFVVTANTFTSAKKFSLYQTERDILNRSGTYGWSTYSPWMDDRFYDNNIDRHSNFLLDDNVYMLTRDLSNADRLNAYYKSEGIIDSDYEVVDTKLFRGDIQVFVVKWYPPT